MKNLTLVLSVLFLGMQAVAWGADTPSAPSENRPCKQIESACQSAGFFKGGHKEGKGLWKDCFQSVMAGKAVAGVSVDASTVQACQAKKAKRQAKHAK